MQTIDKITSDAKNNEIVLYLLEDGPWPESDSDLRAKLKSIETRIVSAAYYAISGDILKQYPDIQTTKFRVQIDSPHGAPEALQILINMLKEHIQTDAEWQKDIALSTTCKSLRLVTGHELGRFKTQ